MDKGRVVAQGPISELKQPRGQVFELRVKAVDALEPFILRLQQAGFDCHTADDDVMRVFVPGEAGARDLFAAAVAAGVQVRHLRPSVRDPRGRVRAGARENRNADPRSRLPPVRGTACPSRPHVDHHRAEAACGRCSAAAAFVALLLLSWLPFLVRAVQIYAATNLPQAQFLAPTGETFRQFLGQQEVFLFFITVYAGAGLIANDRRANALQIYLSKPLTRIEYVVGKLAVLFTFLLLVTWVPAMMLLLVQVLFAGNFTFLLENRVPRSRPSRCSPSSSR